MQYSLNIKGHLMDLAEPKVMGILNVTPDSFFADSRKQTEKEILMRAEEILAQGGDIIDVGACSTRPNSTPADGVEELKRLSMALAVIRNSFRDAVISVDTFRAEVAQKCIDDFGADIINDVSEGADENMFNVVAKAGVPYVLTSQQKDMRSTLMALSAKVQKLRDLGQKDIILDPGFGFGKSTEDNFEMLNDLDKLLCVNLPVLVGLSHKSMILKVLDVEPKDALNGTIALNTIALTKGASILRVHDVRGAKETIKLMSKLELCPSHLE